MVDDTSPQDLRYRIRRDASGVWTWVRGMWRANLWFRIAGIVLGVFAALYLLVWVTVARNLPSADTLLTYQPPLPTMVRGVNGEIVYSYARERRVQLRFVDYPRPVVNAFLSAEDKTFWSHGGIDYLGVASAVFDYATKLGSGERARAADRPLPSRWPRTS